MLRAEHHEVDDEGNKVPVAVSFGQVSQPYPGEYRNLEPDVELLECSDLLMRRVRLFDRKLAAGRAGLG